MAEPRRVSLTTLPVSAPLLKKKKEDDEEEEEEEVVTVTATAAAATATATVVLVKGEISAVTSRHTLALFESSEKSCPEFFYPELMRVRKKDAAKRFDAPFNVDKREEEIETLAKKFEEKYGPKKRRKDRIQDLIDMGYGYDETDPFIDNSEAYDELVPASLTTKLGGFYINSGTLQFRQASESDGDEDFVKDKKKTKSPKKRKLKESNEKMKKRRKEDGHEKEKKSQKSKISKQAGFMPLNVHKEDKKKKKKYMGALGVREMLKKFEKEKEALKKREDQKSLPISQTMAGTPLETDNSSININVSDPLLSLIGSANESDLLKVASTVDLEIDLERLLNDSPPGSPLNDFDDGSDPLPVLQYSAMGQTSKQVPTLPEGLPALLEKCIKELTQAAKASEGEGKQKFFTQDVNNILLNIELQSRELNSQARSGVYAHLASFLPCSKDTLVKRAKKLHMNEQTGAKWLVKTGECFMQDGRLKEPIHKLKEAIGKAMPNQMAKYQDDCQAHSQAKIAKMMGEDKDQKERMFSDDDDDEDKLGRRIVGPRKKFHWNDEIRDLLCSVVRTKMACYEQERNKSQIAEDYLKAFLESEVKPLWPKGWMQARTLFKESRKVHAHVTSIPTKKKVIAAPKTKMKDQMLKTERKLQQTSTPVHCSNAGSIVQGSCTPPVTPINVSVSSNAAQSSSNTTTPQSFSLDDSLDEDLPNNQPSLEDVSVALAALNDAAGGTKSFSSLVSNSLSDQVTVAVSSEEKKHVQKVPTPSSAPSPAAQSHSPLNLLAEQALALGQLSQERTSESATSLITAFKNHSSANSKGFMETLQSKPKHLGVQRTSQPQVQNQVSTQAAKQYHQTTSHQKNFMSPPSFSISKLQSSSQTKAPSQLQHRPLIQHLKTSTKTQNFHSVSSSLASNMQTSPSPQRTLGTSVTSASCTAKHTNSQSSANQTFKSPMTVVTATKHSTPSSNPIQNISSIQTSMSSCTHLNRQSPSPGQALNRQSPNINVKKPSISQKLTLVAPPGGSNGDSSSGTQGVAKLLTSSLKSSAVNSSTATGAMLSLQATTGTALLASSPSLSLLSPSFNTANQKITSATLSQASLGMMPGIVPMHFTFPTVLTLGSDSTPKSAVSTDAIVTGPAPGTFHHGLAHSIFAGLHTTPHHAVQLPHAVLPTHLQQSLQDSNKIHGETSSMQRKMQ
ncbi:ubinuclein-1-like isoform X4 [Carcharodon carcharias]|uniref:ubinuclein-1-like isoform X4 n=1 Tax=Carcharodon carcharias TaxID=13397 RepID=UPI001B7E7DF9|nr:ubinuclein-1-like isoform X4 [Carcharodon carcharias]